MKKTGLICFAIFVIVVTIGLIRGKITRNKIANKSHGVACARIIGGYWRRGSYYVKVQFKYLNKEYVWPKGWFNEIGITNESYKKYNDGNPFLLIVFPADDPTSIYTLETESNFKEFNIIPSDTAGIKCQ